MISAMSQLPTQRPVRSVRVSARKNSKPESVRDSKKGWPVMCAGGGQLDR